MSAGTQFLQSGQVGEGGIADLDVLVKSISPVLVTGEYRFCTALGGGSLKDFIHLEPLGSFREKEGLTLILPSDSFDGKSASLMEQLQVAPGSFSLITLDVHSSLEAVGLTAAVSAALTGAGISANIVAGYFHDHIFVSSVKAQEAMRALIALSTQGLKK